MGQWTHQVFIDRFQTSMLYTAFSGRLAQLGERFPHTEEVTGSSPVSPTTPYSLRDVGRRDVPGGFLDRL